MISWEELKTSANIIRKIDWDITPQEAFEAYQIKSINAWKHRNLPDVIYFHIFVWQGRQSVYLMKRTYRDSEEIAEAPVPPDMITDCLAPMGGSSAPTGHYAINDPIKGWLKKELRL
jgi:hypothetical protein